MPIERPLKTVARRRRALAAPLSLVGHGLALMALVWTPKLPPPPPDTAQMTASLVDGAILTSAPKPPEPAKPAPPKPTPPKSNVRRAARPRLVDPLPADETPTKAPMPELSEAQLIGAATADSGPPGAGSGPKGQHCNMAQLLQSALRRDRLVQTAAAEAHRGKAMMVWNGDWVRSSAEDGKGLAAVREAIMWEVGFAPATCRSEPMHGLVLLSLNDAPGSPRLVVGSGQWRWSDLLH
jgi:hypothetical protein